MNIFYEKQNNEFYYNFFYKELVSVSHLIFLVVQLLSDYESDHNRLKINVISNYRQYRNTFNQIFLNFDNTILLGTH